MIQEVKGEDVTVESFEAAQALAAADIGAPVEEWGTEDESAYQVFPVADDDLEVLDAPAVLVDKATGVVSRVTVLPQLKRLTSMSPVGVGHPADLFV